MFLGCSGKIGGSGGSAAGGVFILIEVSKTTNLGGTSGTQKVRFWDLQICGAKKWMDDLQIHNSQLANTKTWHTLDMLCCVLISWM